VEPPGTGQPGEPRPDDGDVDQSSLPHSWSP
jgi:hypothetical protein